MRPLSVTILAVLATSCSGGTKLGPECTDYLGEEGCCLVAAGDNAAAVDACQQAAASYASSPDPQAAEESCRAAREAAMATGLCPGGTDATDGGAPDRGQKTAAIC